jgi:uncharacterized protein (TIGR02466 family)
MNMLPVFPLGIGLDKIEIPSIEFIKNIEMEPLANGKGFSSIDRQVLNKTEFAWFKQKIQEKVEDYFYEQLRIDSKIKIRISNSWITKFEQNGWGYGHFHDHSIYSGVLYLNADSNSGMLRFYKGQNINQMGNPPLITLPFEENVQWNLFNSPAWNYSPNTGDILLFPSHMQHEITKNYSTEDRYSLAFNTFISGTLGEKDGELTL